MTVTGLFTWLGGGRTSEIAYRHEHTSYAVTGAAVLLFAGVSGLLTALALASTDGWLIGAVVTCALAVTLLAGVTARALATARPTGGPDRLGLLARITVAVLAGGLIAEPAAIVVFGGTVDQVLDVKAQRSLDSAPLVIAARTDLDKVRGERTLLDHSIAAAQADIDNALVTARCEYNPTPECPQTRITGVPGRGPEAQTANEMLDDARERLATEQSRVDGLDRRIATDEKAVATARSAAFENADRGLGARWQAMNNYTTADSGSLALRILTIVAMIALALLPLVLRWWRGETSFDRQNAARGVLDRAERAADTAIAVKRAEVRAEAETLRAEQQLTAARLVVQADTAIDRERQRTRIIAAIGGIEIGITEPSRRGEPSGILADGRMGTATPKIVPPNLPAPVITTAVTPAVGAPISAAAQEGFGGLELPLIGALPFTDTAARFIRPLVPSFVANAIDTATHPLRIARHAFEEVEEITFTLRRTRKVTVDSQVAPGPGYRLTPGSAEARHAEHIAATVVDADYTTPQDPHRDTLASTAGRNPELPSHHRNEPPPGR